MEDEIKLVLESYGLRYVKIFDDNEDSLQIIYDLLCKNKTCEPTNAIQCFYYGAYYDYIMKNEEKMKKNYMMAIDLGSSEAMSNFGKFYYDKGDYEEMKKYYEMGVDKGNSFAMGNFAIYYRYIKKDYEKMEKYYMMAIDKGNSAAMTNIGNYYRSVKDYEKMKKYYVMAADQGSVASIYNFAIYLQGQNEYKLMKKYYVTAITKGHTKSMYNLGHYYQTIKKDYEKMIKYYMMAIDKGHSGAKNNLYFYYKTMGDLSFLKYTSNTVLYSLLNEKFSKNIKLPLEYYQTFCKLDIQNENVVHIVKLKQYILRTTGIFPSNYSDTYLIPFMQMLSISNMKDCYLPRYMMLRIAGFLFI